MNTLIKVLYKLHFITPIGFLRLIYSFLREGLTIMSILRFSRTYYGAQEAIVMEDESLRYGELYDKAILLTKMLYHDKGLRKNMYVGVLCRNHILSAMLLPALSRLGVHIRLLNTDIGSEKMAGLLQTKKLDWLIYDEELKEKCIPACVECQTVTTDELQEKLSKASGRLTGKGLPHVFQGGQIAVLTGGTSGNYKEASRKTSLFQFLPPFFALLEDIKIQEYKSVFLALPFYHGFGLGVLIIAMAMGKKICMSRHFHTEDALNVVEREKVEVLPIVPTMLTRMWQAPRATEQMRSVKCIISGGDRLDKKLVDETHAQLGPVMFNLYGTSEAGFFMMATPADLDVNSETTLGKPIKGVECDVRDVDENGVGVLWVRSKWAMIGAQNQWQSTGDFMYRDENGYYFHRGIAKNMVVCGGENVFPESVEQIINQHPDVVTSKVFGVPNEEFGFVLNAVVELREDVSIAEADLKLWLKTKLSRPEMPHKIEFKKLEVLSTGKRGRSS